MHIKVNSVNLLSILDKMWKEIKINGMRHESCERRILNTLINTDGISNADISLEHGIAVIQFNEKTLKLKDVISIINGLGYRAHDPHADPFSIIVSMFKK